MQTKKELPPLVPDRHPQGELFLCDLTDAVLKDDMASMEHPVFSLSKKPDMAIKCYENNGNSLEVQPSIHGHATIYDKDILIFAVSQLMAAKKAGKEISQRIVFDARDALVFMNRQIGGTQYRALEKSLNRLKGTTLKTNIKTGDTVQTDIFGLIESATVHRQHADGRVVAWGIKLSDWLFNAIKANEVLTLHPDYFRLRRPIEKRLYELARKHCGMQEYWSVNLDLLQKKAGSNMERRNFREVLRGLANSDHLPDYLVELSNDDKVTFKSKRFAVDKAPATTGIVLDGDTYHDARQVAPGWDVRFLEERWRAWILEGGMEPPTNPDKAFIGFCRSWYTRKGAPS